MSVTLGPVSTVLEADIRDWLARHNLVIWPDADDHYSDFVRQLIQLRAAKELKYDVYTFHGSYLELMFELEDVAGGVDKTRALIHLPGFNHETIKSTPLFELYRAGKRYQKALSTLVADAAANNVRPDQIDDFLGRNNLTLAAADVWLHDLLTEGSEGLASQLRNVSLTELVDDLLLERSWARRVEAAVDSDDDMDQQALRDRIIALTGMPEEWFNESLTDWMSSSDEYTSASAVAYAVCSLAMCVSYVHDLNVAPRTSTLNSIPELPGKVKKNCDALVVQLQNGTDGLRQFYRHVAQKTESRIPDDAGQVAAADLGGFDTFSFEEEAILKASLQALRDGEWQSAYEWSQRRADPNAFWLRDAPLRRNSWQLVTNAARLGVAIAEAGPTLQATDSVPSAVEEYIRVGAEVDQGHRHLEQNRQKLWHPQIAEADAIRDVLDQMQIIWRNWADGWALAFNAVCATHGFLPESSRQQRTVFDDEVKPLTSEHGTTAYFVVDALRYEMGQELMEAIQGTAQTNVKLAWRLAELPSVTEVGMNVLAPVASNGRLQPSVSNGKISGFATGEFRVSSPDTRQRAMHDRVGGRTCPKIELDEVLRLDTGTLKRKIAGARLVMVHSREIDNTGEAGFGPSVFEEILRHLKSAWHLLRDAGVRHFVFAADHGFLLLNEDSHPNQPHGGKRDPNRRHVILEHAADHAGEVRVTMRDLGYDCDDLHLMFPASTAVFDTGRKRKGFAHGGNSFQERVIPVLTVSHRVLAGGSTTGYDITAVKKQEVAGMHCIAAKVSAAQKSFDFGSSYEVDLGLRVPEAKGVRAELCETRGGARLSSGTIVAKVGEEFELFFRLAGSSDSRVLIELYHPNAEADVQPCSLKARFAVSYTAETPSKPTTIEPVEITEEWLKDLPDGPIRRVFQHLSVHGTVTEAEVSEMLGSPREQRRFARNFENYAASVPFTTSIDVVSGVKRYVREGSPS